MAEVPGAAPYREPVEPVEDVRLPVDSELGGAPETPTWLAYPGPPESVSDGVSPRPALAPQRRGSLPWTAALVGTAAVVVATVAAIVAATIVMAPISPGPAEPQPAEAVAPDFWNSIDPSLTAGLVIVEGGGEADGIVVTADGLVATSYSRITGELRPPTEKPPIFVEDGRDAFSAKITSFDAATDIAFVRAKDFVPSSVARPGTPARVGETLILLNDQSGGYPVLGIGVTVTATDHGCSRAGSRAHPVGFQFSLDTASAEPGGALVRTDGTVVGMYFGGDDATHHCAIPIADIVGALADR